MNISMVGRKVELTDSIKEYINGAIESLVKYNLDIISINIVVSLDEKKNKKGIEADFTINLAHKGTVVIKQKDKDLYAAIDLAVDRAQKVLRRHHDKVIGHRNDGVEISNQKLEKKIEDIEDEIVPMELELYKPMELEEAIQRLNESNESFYVFNDYDDHMRVIYKQGERKYGLY